MIDNARLFRDAQAAETRYRGLFEGVADAILVTDEARRLRDANAAACALLGYTREELLRLRLEELVARDLDWTKQEFARYRSEGEWHGEIELRRRDGSTVPVEARATVVALPTGPVFLSAIRDVTERKQIEDFRRDFLAMVGHDLRNPLTTVRIQAQLLQRRGEYRESAVAAILSESARMARLVDDLADVVRLEAGHLELQRTAVDLTALAQQLAAVAETESGSHRIVVAPSPAVVGSWDADRLTQVLRNLLANAIKYSPPGGEIAIRIEVDPREARLAVTDQGPGIAADHLPRLFDRFYRAGAESGGGLGLGLYISRMLVEAHGGRIRVASIPGTGSTFTITLPREGDALSGPG